MHTFFRLTILGVFGAAGVGIAISLAMRAGSEPATASRLVELTAVAEDRAPSSNVRPDETATLAVAKDEANLDQIPAVLPTAVVVTQPQRQTPAEAVVVQPASAMKDETPASQSPAPQAPLLDPVIQHIERLEDTLSRMQEATKQSQFERLAAKIDQLADHGPRVVQGPPPSSASPPSAESPAEGAADSPKSATLVSLTTDTPGDDSDPLLTFDRTGADLLETLNAISIAGDLNIVASANVKGNVTCSFNMVTPKDALTAILQGTGYASHKKDNFIYVGTPEDLAWMEPPTDLEPIRMEVYRTKYMTAAELQQLITPLLTPDVGTVTISTPADVGIPASIVETGGDGFAGNEVVIVQDFNAVHEKVEEVIRKVDQPPRQVLIEAMILSVNLDDEHKFGINFELFKNSGTLALASGSPLASLGALDFASGGLNFGLLRSGAGAFIAALEQIGDTNVIAAPRLLCLNKQRAEILIGDQKGFISTTQTETSTTQSVEFLDIGTQLRIRPFISDDGVIRLEVHPELSTGDVKLIGEFALPEKSVTQVTTNIMCRDGCTVVLGGLIREDYGKQVSQVAGVGNLPVVGALFRNKTENVTRNEIIVLITPHIIKGKTNHEVAADVPGPDMLPDIFGRQSMIESRKIDPSRKFSRIAARCYSDRYYRLAQTSWVAGNAQETMRYLDLSLRFNPRNDRAWHLRGEVGGVPEYELIEGEVPAEQPEPLPAQEASNVKRPVPVVRPNLGPAPIIPFEPIDDVSFETDSFEAN